MIRVDTTELDAAAAALRETGLALAHEGDGLAATRWQTGCVGDGALAAAVETFAGSWTVGLGAHAEDVRRVADALTAAALGYDVAERAAEGAFDRPPTTPPGPATVTH